MVHTVLWPHYPNGNVFSDRRNRPFGKSASLRCDDELFHSLGCKRCHYLYVRIPILVCLCIDVLSEQKRVRLLMQVFLSSDIVRDESVAVVKFRVWWHFVVSLKDKATPLFAEVSVLDLRSDVTFIFRKCSTLLLTLLIGGGQERRLQLFQSISILL